MKEYVFNKVALTLTEFSSKGTITGLRIKCYFVEDLTISNKIPLVDFMRITDTTTITNYYYHPYALLRSKRLS